jgi:hypothetical protein
METGDELCEPPAIGSPVVFKYERGVLRGRVIELPYLVALEVTGAVAQCHLEPSGGDARAKEKQAVIIMLAAKRGRYPVVPESCELLCHEGIYWARGWDTEDALALQAQARLAPRNTGTGGNYVVVTESRKARCWRITRL